jgi:tRNA A-37 threonylcarbamoyl transferase component Bud32
VYQVADLRLLGKLWAAKEMSDAGLTDPIERQDAIARFKQEAQILAKLHHPNIPQVVDSFQEGNKHYIVMDYVDGDTLCDRMAKRGAPFKELEVRPWLTQLCDVLSYLHAQQPCIIFRDLKPQNIMVDRAGHIKLIDFGIARFLKPGKAKDTTSLGTEGYAAPEAHGQGQTDARSDIFSLGVSLYELLTGLDPTQTPYNFPPIRKLAPTVSPAMEVIVQRAIALQPEKRWQSIADIQDALKGKWSGRATSPGATAPTIGAGPVSLPQQMPYVGQPARRNRPTTRLLMAAATLSNEQLAAVLVAVSAAVALGVWLLAPVVEREAPVIWNNVPVFLIAGLSAYAAVQGRGTALIAHVVVTLVGWVTWWARSGYVPSSYMPLLMATCLSGGVIELAMAYLPRVKSKEGADAWKREVEWYACAAVAAAITFFAVQSGVFYALQPGMWIGSAIVGALGWFLGDLMQQWLFLRTNGFQRPGQL